MSKKTFHCRICSDCTNLYVCSLKGCLFYCKYATETDSCGFNSCQYAKSDYCVINGGKFSPITLCKNYENLMEAFDNAK